MAEEDPPPPAPDAEAPSSPDEGDTRSRLAEAQLEQAMEGYHSLLAENEVLVAQIAEMRQRQLAAGQDRDASLARQKKAAARELKSEREGIYTRYIEILDNFDRAFDTPEARAASDSLMEGFILVRNQVVQVLRDGGLDRVRTLGLPFDPNTSEAMDIEDVSDPARDGMVIRELVRGYRLNESVVRAAKVVVGRFTEPPDEDSGEILNMPEETADESRTVDAPEEEES